MLKLITQWILRHLVDYWNHFTETTAMITDNSFQKSRLNTDPRYQIVLVFV